MAKLNSEDLKDFIKHVVSNNHELQEKNIKPITINIEGPAGIGKTSIVEQVANEMGYHYVKINLGQLEEIGDLVGFPYKEFQVVNSEGKSKWIQESVMDTYLKEGFVPNGESRMSHAVPSWVHNLPENGILNLDDYSRADQRFMQSLMEVCDRQEYISWKLPKGWTVVLTTNPDNGEYNVTTLDIAQKTRFITVEAKFDVKSWAKWAESENIDTRCINFLLMHKELVTEEVNPRAITTFFNSISSIKDFDSSLAMIQILGEGSVGETFASMFTLFINNRLDKLVNPYDLLFSNDEKKVIKELEESVGIGGSYRADIASVLATRVINILCSHANENVITNELTNRILKLTTDCESFNTDIQYVIIKELVGFNKTKFSKLLLNPAALKMTMR